MRMRVCFGASGDSTAATRSGTRTVEPTTPKNALRRSSKLAAHDEANDAHVGDTVRVMETRPLSKTKRWRVVEVIERAK